MLPIYSTVSFLSYLNYQHAIYYEVARDCYEAFAIASFFTLMCHYIAPNLHEQKDYFRQLTPINWFWAVFGLQKCTGGQDRGILRRPRSGLTWFNVRQHRNIAKERQAKHVVWLTWLIGYLDRSLPILFRPCLLHHRLGRHPSYWSILRVISQPSLRSCLGLNFRGLCCNSGHVLPHSILSAAQDGSSRAQTISKGALYQAGYLLLILANGESFSHSIHYGSH